MLTVHLLGHAHVTYNSRPVPLSTKAVALITYLTIEKLPQHRERLADLLWNTPEARKNLRVELARIRSAGLDIFPLSRQLLYLENVETDLNVWLTQLGSELDQAGLAQWLSTLRGVPLSGLEDLGSPAFQEWIDHQRWVLTEQTEEVLNRAYGRFHRGGKVWATRAIAARAEALGFTHPGEFLPEAEAPAARPPAPQTSARAAEAGPEKGVRVPGPETDGHDPQTDLHSPAHSPVPGPDAPLHFSAPAREAALQGSLHRAAHKPQVVVLHGPTGSGKSYEADHALAGEQWLALRVSNSRAGRLVLATLAQSLLSQPSLAAPSDASQSTSTQAARDQTAHDQTASAQILRDVLLHPGSLEEDVVKVATVLATVPRPLAIVLDHAHNGPVELASLLEFLLNVPAAGPRALVMLSRTPPSQAPLCRALLRRFGTQQSLLLEVTPLSLGSVMRALDGRGAHADLHAQAAVMLQRSGGNALHLLSLLEQAGPQQAEPGPPGLAQDQPGYAARRAVGSPLPGSRLPTAMRDTYLGEIDGWPAPLRDALSSLSVIQGDFSYGLVGSFPDAARASLTPAALLRGALTHRALVEAEPSSALAWPDFGPVEDTGHSELCYRFRSEGLRIALSSLLSQTDRQELRRHLVGVLEAAQPGLALYYAERADVPEDAERLRRAYRAHLPAGSPLLRPLSLALAPVLPPDALDSSMPAAHMRPAQVLSAPVLPPPTPRPAPEPRRTYASASAAVPWQGYLLSWEQGGWLSVLSQGRYGQPHTLRVHLPVSPSLRDAPTLTLRVVWRLDVFHGGHELGPNHASFPLRFSILGADGARVLTPEAGADYTEEGLLQQVASDVTLGGWMEHELSFNVAGQPVGRLELAVRALDLALTIGELNLNGQSILPLATTPERLGVTGDRENLPALRPLATRG